MLAWKAHEQHRYLQALPRITPTSAESIHRMAAFWWLRRSIRNSGMCGRATAGPDRRETIARQQRRPERARARGGGGSHISHVLAVTRYTSRPTEEKAWFTSEYRSLRALLLRVAQLFPYFVGMLAFGRLFYFTLFRAFGSTEVSCPSSFRRIATTHALTLFSRGRENDVHNRL